MKQSGSPEVAFRVAVKDGKVNFTARGLKGGNRVTHIYDFNVGLGGPIKSDRLWFFATWRKFSTNDVVANTFYKEAPRAGGPARAAA